MLGRVQPIGRADPGLGKVKGDPTSAKDPFLFFTNRLEVMTLQNIVIGCRSQLIRDIRGVISVDLRTHVSSFKATRSRSYDNTDVATLPLSLEISQSFIIGSSRASPNTHLRHDFNKQSCRVQGAIEADATIHPINWERTCSNPLFSRCNVPHYLQIQVKFRESVL